MALIELTDEQRRQTVDARQAFNAWHAAALDFRHGYRGSMRWHTVAGHVYLSRKFGSVWKQLGIRSPATEQIKADYTDQRAKLRQRLTRTNKRLQVMAPVNRALDLGRIPTIAGRVIRRLDEAGLLGKSLIVVGTHSLFAYEAAAGVVLDGALTATTDIDLLFDARSRLSLALVDVRAEGVIGLLRKVDRSFTAKGYSASNDDGYSVDLIAPASKRFLSRMPMKTRLSDVAGDLDAVPTFGLDYLINVPKFETVAIGMDGLPLRMVCTDPRAFALHKHWLSRLAIRDPVKRRRDAAQAIASAALATRYFNLELSGKDLSALPAELMAGAMELQRLIGAGP